MDQQFKIPRVLPVQQPQTTRQPGRTSGKPTESFAQVLESKLQQPALKFSAHAAKRLESRGIRLTDDQLNTLEEAVEKARKKGGEIHSSSWAMWPCG